MRMGKIDRVRDGRMVREQERDRERERKFIKKETRMERVKESFRTRK